MKAANTESAADLVHELSERLDRLRAERDQWKQDAIEAQREIGRLLALIVALSRKPQTRN